MLNKFKVCLGLGSLLAASFTAAVAAPPARGPFDAKAREIFEKVISIPTSLGNRKVPEMAEYLAGEFRAAGFPGRGRHHRAVQTTGRSDRRARRSLPG